MSYTKINEVVIDEIGCTLIEMKHDLSGADVIHIACDDEEKLFALCFKTHPSDSTGVAHILEHTVLCGSKHFPVRDPFFSMLKRSLNTFLNAMTGADFTVYPAASTIDKDFYNLFEVYLDAVFYPKLEELAFRQEGHRLEFEDGKLKFKGVVFNEMKGVLSSPDSRLWNAIAENLYPDLTYAFESGGDPKEIPNLTYEAFLGFWKKFYHPSQSLFFSYGNLDLDKHLAFIEEKVLKDVTPGETIPKIGLQKRFSEHRVVEASYPTAAGSDDKALFGLAYLTCPVTEEDEVLALSLVDALLMETDASPLKRALLESGLVKQADAYLDTETSEVPYLLLCRGMDSDDSIKVESLVRKTLENLAPFPDDQIEAALHSLEFSKKEIAPQNGLHLAFRVLMAKQLGTSVENSLKIVDRFDALRERLKDKNFIPSLIKKYLLDNMHHVLVTLKPDENLLQKEQEEEEKRLSNLVVDKEAIDKQAAALKELQETEEDLSCLPAFHLKDVPEEIIYYPLTTHELPNLTVHYHGASTNKIVYMDLYLDLPDLPSEKLQAAKFATSIFTELGAGGRTFEENLHRINLKTGDMGASLGIFTQFEDPGAMRPAFILSGKALERNAFDLLNLMQDFLTKPRLDEKDRIFELTRQLQSDLKRRLKQNPLSMAMNTSLSGMCQQSAIQRLWGGLEYKTFLDEHSNNLPDLSVMHDLLHLLKPTLVITCSEKMLETLLAKDFGGLGHLHANKHPLWNPTIKPFDQDSTALLIPSAVSFTAASLKTIYKNHPDSVALEIASMIFRDTTLHKRIREQGGAYGSGASYNPMYGSFTFHTYRDPNFTSSLNAFDESIQSVINGNFTDEDLTGAKLRALQNIYSPEAPGSRANLTYSFERTGQTHAYLKQRKDKIVSLTREDLIQAVKSHLQNKEKTVISCMGQELYDKEASHLPSSKLL
ncbi:MAG: hypothetical protein SP1CHLAM54_03040 [Chlamydiia bacterium]|nr:hypothetical protein [Chlamydiia bacterium]MCH9615220.1 hypothetical protein [Chlamydiia bacterium]MCH9628458.1 hypothetical protein [Chlamydiia bacterium]